VVRFNRKWTDESFLGDAERMGLLARLLADLRAVAGL
jgi:hypothetical protein